MPYLIMRRGPRPGSIYELEDDIVTIGRGHRNSIVVQDNEVSREHCQLVRHEDGYELQDAGSSNGTFVNGHPADEGWLLPDGCLIEMGDTITFEYIDSTEQGTAEAAISSNSHAGYPSEPELQAYLVVRLQSQQEHEVYPLLDETILVGRDFDNDIVIPEPEMSRVHMQLTYGTGGYVVEDMGSTNGTAVNGKRLTSPISLKSDDLIQVGTMVQILYTHHPESVGSMLATDTLPTLERETTSSTRKRITNTALMEQMHHPPQPSEVGTGLEAGALEGQVFIAYARKDWEEVVAPLFDRFHDERLPAWADQYLTPGEDDWKLAIQQAMVECEFLVVVVSPAAMETSYVKRSVRHFLNRSKEVILLVYQPIKRAPIGWKNLVTVHYNHEDPERTLQALVAEIRRRRT